jgi:hypothetical protein
MTMRQIEIPLAAICLLIIGLTAPLAAQPAGREGPCRQIAAACRSAGFERNAARAGNGIVVDCIRPIMQATPQPPRASKALPQVDPQLVAACQANNPDFGQAPVPPTQPAAQPAPASPPASSPAVPAPAVPAPTMPSPPPQARAISGRRPNVVIVLTDDVADDLLQCMPHVLQRQDGARDQ